MPTLTEFNPLHQDCLGHLRKVLELAMHTAEAASAAGNHKLVLQAVREVTRIITLINKMTRRTEEVKPASPKGSRPIKTPPAPILNQEVDPAPDPEADLLQGIFQELLSPHNIRPATESMEQAFHGTKKKPSLSSPRAWLKNLTASQGPSGNAAGVGGMQPGTGQ